MDTLLLEEVSARLHSDAQLAPEIRRLLVAALFNELDAVLGGGSVVQPSTPPTLPTTAEPQSERVYVRSVSIAGFRGVGPKAKLDLAPGPGLTLVVGRNGSGKSSFAEGLELLLTGDNKRWSERHKEWQTGFRNVHAPGSVQLDAELLIEGSKTSHARRYWKKDEDLNDGKFSLTVNETTHTSTSSIGWKQPMDAFRPFLSYNEIGSILDRGPANLFDSMNPVLGLADLSDATDRLKSRQKELKELEKGVTAQLTEIQETLAKIYDERAETAKRALAGSSAKWKLEEVADLIAHDALADDRSVSARLASLAKLPGPNLETVAGLAAELRSALDRQREILYTDGERARRLLALLEHALEFHNHAGDGDCPVCGQVAALDSDWSMRTAAAIANLRQDAELSSSIHRAVEDVTARIKFLLVEPPVGLDDAGDVGLAVDEALSIWSRWAALREKLPEVLVEQLEDCALDLASAVEKVRRDAEERLQALEREWREVAADLHLWLPSARKVVKNLDLIKQLDRAEKRLVGEIEKIRSERFEPIKSQVLQYWNLLRNRSSVDISDLELAGRGTRRKVKIDVAVDGAEAAALGVMSQGELHALALSLFLPRATIKASPFGFLFIDDPVQAMDMARVDGLARVLREVARTHQVVVFTHDDRLPEAVRRLQVEARVLEVDRNPESVIEIRPTRDPVRQHLADAFALAKTEELPPGVAIRVIPGLCRSALEAACTEVIRRRRLSAGDSHAAVETLLRDNHGLNPLFSLAMTDDPGLVQEARQKLRRMCGRDAAEVIYRCKKGAHGDWDGDLKSLLEEVRIVALRIQEMQ